MMNIGDTFPTGPKEAAYVVNTLVRPNAAIASRANGAATEGGKLAENSRTQAFSKAANMPVHLPLSGRTMEFNANGTCVSGCQGRHARPLGRDPATMPASPWRLWLLDAPGEVGS